MTTMDNRAREILAPGGILKAALNFSNPVIAVRGADGRPGGVSAMLSRQLAERLGVELQVVPFDSPAASFEAAKANEVGIAFLAVEEKRAESVVFAPAYVEIEATYLVPRQSAIETCADVDAPGRRVAVNKGAGYDNYLRRNLQHTAIVHTSGMQEAVTRVTAGEAEAAAGIRQALDRAAAANPQLRVLGDRFTSIRHSVCVPNERREAVAFLTAVVADAIRNGDVARALAESGNDPAIVVRNYPGV